MQHILFINLPIHSFESGYFLLKLSIIEALFVLEMNVFYKKRRKSREDYPEIEIQRERFSYDLCLEEARRLIPANVTLLEDCGIEYDGITFYAISCRMIQQMQWLGEEYGLSYKTDFLITHIPPKGILDEDTGSEILKQIILERQPKYHLSGHVHYTGGLWEEKWSTKFGNVSTFQALCKIND